MIDTGTACYVCAIPMNSFVIFIVSEVQYVSPLKFIEPNIPGNEIKKVDLKNVSLKMSQAINLFQ